MNNDERPAITGISAVTFYSTDMLRAVRFYTTLGFACVYGGANAAFTSLRGGEGFINLIAGTPPTAHWGRVIIHVADVDVMYNCARQAGYATLTSPRDAEWGERYFHILDPDGNELSFARPLTPR